MNLRCFNPSPPFKKTCNAQRDWFSLGAPGNTSCCVSQMASDALPLLPISISSGGGMAFAGIGVLQKITRILNIVRGRAMKTAIFLLFYGVYPEISQKPPSEDGNLYPMANLWEVHTFPPLTGKGTRVASTSPAMAADREVMRKPWSQVSCSSLIWFFSPHFPSADLLFALQ